MRAVIVSHGQPGDPGPQQQAIEALAVKVGAHAPALDIRGATLAMPGALAATADDDSLIYPMFMAEGWFTRSELPRRLAAAGAAGARIMRPFGHDPALPGLAVRQVQAAASARGWPAAEVTLMLSAHGSGRSQASANGAHALAALIAPHFARVVTGFVEQEPFIHDAARDLRKAVSLPFFALQAEHVLHDLPEALDRAGFDGPRLPPIGLAPEVPGLIAAALIAAMKGQPE